MLERSEQIRTQPPFLLAHRIQITALQQQSEKTLREILRIFHIGALSPYVTINWSPISAAKCFECRLCSWRWALRLQHHSPVRSCKRDRSAIGASANGGQRSDLIIRRGHISDPTKNPRRTQASITLKGATAWAAVHLQTVTAGKPSFLAMLCAQPRISCAQLLESERLRKLIRCS